MSDFQKIPTFVVLEGIGVKGLYFEIVTIFKNTVFFDLFCN